MRWSRRRSADQPATIEEWLRVFPPVVRDGLHTVYRSLGPEQRRIIDPLLAEMSRYMTAGDLKYVLTLVKEQFPDLEDSAAKICIVGPVNTGKSALYNTLVSEEEAKAEVSPVPGTTKSPQSGASGILTVVDTPGADDVELGEKGSREGLQRRQAAFAAAAVADFLVIVFDASVGIGQGALTVYQDLSQLDRPHVIVLNKIDLVGRHKDQVIELAARNLQVDRQAIIPTSALRGTGLDALIFTIIKAHPKLVLSVARVMPRYRFKLAQRRTIQAATAAGSVNLATSPIPIPFASFVPLTGIQVGLVLSIARIYDHQVTRARARELFTTFAAGMGARTLFQQLVTKIPGAGWALGTAIAAATTLAIGYVAIAWFARGEQVTAAMARTHGEAITREILAALREVDRDSLSREGLKTILETTMAGIFGQLEQASGADAP